MRTFSFHVFYQHFFVFINKGKWQKQIYERNGKKNKTKNKCTGRKKSTQQQQREIESSFNSRLSLLKLFLFLLQGPHIQPHTQQQQHHHYLQIKLCWFVFDDRINYDLKIIPKHYLFFRYFLCVCSLLRCTSSSSSLWPLLLLCLAFVM